MPDIQNIPYRGNRRNIPFRLAKCQIQGSADCDTNTTVSVNEIFTQIVCSTVIWKGLLAKLYLLLRKGMNAKKTYNK